MYVERVVESWRWWAEQGRGTRTGKSDKPRQVLTAGCDSVKLRNCSREERKKRSETRELAMNDITSVRGVGLDCHVVSQNGCLSGLNASHRLLGLAWAESCRVEASAIIHL